MVALVQELESDSRQRLEVGSLASRLDALRSTAELAECSMLELRWLLQYVDELTVPAGSRIANRGQPCSQFVIVAAGRLHVDSPRSGGRTLVPGDSFGWTAMWERSANEATVVVESDARLLILGHAQFRAVKAVAGREARAALRNLPGLSRG